MARARVHLDNKLFYEEVLPMWECSFGIRFGRDDFARAATVGDIWAVVERHLVARIGENQTGLTLAGATQRTFYRLRRALMAQGQARAAVIPRTPLRTLLPWQQRPALLVVALWAAGTVLGWELKLGWGIALINGLAVATIVGQLPWVQWVLPARTLGELTTKVVANNYQALSAPACCVAAERDRAHNRLQQGRRGNVGSLGSGYFAGRAARLSAMNLTRTMVMAYCIFLAFMLKMSRARR